MNLLLQDKLWLASLAAEASNQTVNFPPILIALGAIGFIAAVALGSIAWYNSKRPQGWKDKERPDFVPPVNE